MNAMKFPFKKTALAAALTLAMAGCFHDDTNSKNDTEPTATEQDDTTNYFLVADGEGYVNIYKDNGVATTSTGNFKVSAAGGVTLGEMHFHHGRAFIVIQGGLKDVNGADIGGGVAIVDMKAAIANPGGDVSSFLKIVPLTTTQVTGGPSRIVHTYADPDGEHLWLNNDGPRGNNEPDSVFVINWHHPDAADLSAYAGEVTASVEEIAVGNGHKKSAFSYASTAMPNTPFRFATHNLTDQTVSIIDNGATSLTRHTVLATVDLKTTEQIFDQTLNGGAGGMRNKNNTPHGMDFSIASGRFYVGITPGEHMGLAVIDPAASNTLTSISAGMDATAGQIPAGGYVHASHDGMYVYTVGYKSGHGYLSVIKAEAGMPDTVHQVIDLGDLSASSFDISHMEHVHSGHTEHHLTILVPGSFKSDTNLRNKVAVLEFDHDTGMLKTCSNVFCEASKIRYIDVGATRGEHRNGEISADGMRAVYPNSDCKGTASASASAPVKAIIEAEDGADCKTINVIDVMTGQKTATVGTAGRNPSSVGILSKADLDGATTTSGGHDHHH